VGEYYVKDKTGTLRGFKIKGDTPSPTEQARLDQILSGGQIDTKNAPVDEPGVFGSLVSGLESGIKDVAVQGRTIQEQLATNRGNVESMGGLGKLISENVAPESPQEYRDLADKARKERDSGYNPEGGYLDQPTWKGLAKRAAFDIGNSIPVSAASTAAIVGGGIMGGPAGAAAGTGVATALMYPQMLNENVERQIKDTGGHVNDWQAANLSAGFKAGVEALTNRLTLGVAGLIRKPLEPWLKKAVEEGTQSAIKAGIKRFGVATVNNAFTGGVENTLQAASTRLQAGETMYTPDAIKEYIENAIGGAIGEGAFGAGEGAVGGYLDAKDIHAENAAKADAKAEAERLGQAYATNPAANDRARNPEVVPLTSGLLEDRTVSAPIAPEQIPAPNEAAPEADLVARRTKNGRLNGKFVGSDIKAAIARGADLFSEDEYRNTVRSLQTEKSVSVDKIRNLLGSTQEKAKAIFESMRERGDADATGENSQYLKVKPQRQYVVAPLEEKEQQTHRVTINGRPVGELFPTAEAATEWAQRAGIPKFETVQDKSAQQHGLYELLSQGNQIIGKRLVKGFASSVEARNAARELDPNFGAETNEKNAKLLEDLKQKQIKEAVEKELGPVAKKLQERADQILGTGRVNINVVPMVDAEYLKSIGVPDHQIPKGAIIAEGVYTPDVKTPLKRAIGLSADLYDPSLTQEQKEAALNDVLNHELVHALRNLDLLTEKEWNQLYKHALTEKVPGKPYTHMQLAAARRTSSDPRQSCG
jgi:hypothetical protein